MADRHEPVAVLGLGRFGSALAQELTRQGAEVLAVDRDPREVQAWASELTQVVTADSTDLEALRQLGIGDFTRAVVAMGHIEASILTTSLLVELGVDDIWAKATSRRHGNILERVGAHHVVFPEFDMGERVAHLLSGRMLDYLQVEPDFAVAKLHPPYEAVGKPLGTTGLRARHGITVVAVKSPGSGFTYASQDTVLTHDDVILAIGDHDAIDRLVNREG
ncbi:TrkA family potassium uptake protein [Pseudonocardia sp. C8]|uniref:potassium channel family protein n=1 Tax=Pseudonocardia sp. C8 TaxID=2762759 RepID=UPI001643508C|nr:TrkA family potassium uptake protein [Pseudonocardia sp. C8]MBC3190341.1 TrkA family potassium uptake protein [Pseudonocardia sp. C8]